MATLRRHGNAFVYFRTFVYIFEYVLEPSKHRTTILTIYILFRQREVTFHKQSTNFLDRPCSCNDTDSRPNHLHMLSVKYSNDLAKVYIYLCFEAKDLGIACSIDAQCVAGNGGTGATCDTTCQSGKLNELVLISNFCFTSNQRANDFEKLILRKFLIYV